MESESPRGVCGDMPAGGVLPPVTGLPDVLYYPRKRVGPISAHAVVGKPSWPGQVARLNPPRSAPNYLVLAGWFGAADSVDPIPERGPFTGPVTLQPSPVTSQEGCLCCG